MRRRPWKRDVDRTGRAEAARQRQSLVGQVGAAMNRARPPEAYVNDARFDPCPAARKALTASRTEAIL